MANINRPHVVFESWGLISPDDPLARLIPGPNGELKLFQKGFYLFNHGGPAFDVRVEDFEIEPSVHASSREINDIPEKSRGFALVWVAGYPQPWFLHVEKFDLLETIKNATDKKFGIHFFGPDPIIRIHVRYKDVDNGVHRSSADLKFLRNLSRLEFGPTTYDGVDARESPNKDISVGQVPCATTPITQSPHLTEVPNESIGAAEIAARIAERAKRRQAVVMPILKKKRWTRGRWSTTAGVGKNSVYEYLDGKRNLTEENRKAMAETLGLLPGDLPA